MRTITITISLCAVALAAGQVLAQTGGTTRTEDLINSQPQEIAINHDYGYDAALINLGEARRTCVAAGGTFSNRAGRLACTNPRRVPSGHWRPRPRAR